MSVRQLPRVAGLVVALALALAVAGCGGSDDSSATTTTAKQGTTATSTTAVADDGAKVLTILVSNDDGVKAPGINTLVEALVKLPDTKVVVVAPAENQSGTGGRTTPGGAPATASSTSGGYPATSVAGYPADSVDWALGGGIPETPQLTVTGVNQGQNLGKAIDLSGTVGAARAAATKGVPALAVSAGLAGTVDYDTAATLAVEWVQAHRADLLAGKLAITPAPVENLNVPTCRAGSVRGVVKAQPDMAADVRFEPVDCNVSSPQPSTDVAAFAAGFAPLSVLTATPG